MASARRGCSQGRWLTKSQCFEAWLIRDGQRRSRNIDYFTLIRDGEGQWKIVNRSYTAKPVQGR